MLCVLPQEDDRALLTAAHEGRLQSVKQLLQRCANVNSITTEVCRSVARHNEWPGYIISGHVGTEPTYGHT
jgi:hypothetical protein